MRRLVGALFAAALVATPAFPCGGPGADIVDLPLVPVDWYLAHTVSDDDYLVTRRAELRFLEPFHRASPDSTARVYAFAYDAPASVRDDVADTLRRHYEREMIAPVAALIERGSFVTAAARARQAVTDILDLPAGLAAPFRDALRTAVEAFDIAPTLSAADAGFAARYLRTDSSGRDSMAALGVLPPPLRAAYDVRRLERSLAASYADTYPTSPRMATLRYVALQDAMHAGIPDGWATSTRDSVPPARWLELERLHDDWLRRFGDHPLADYVRLSKVRLFYFAGENAKAWDVLLAMYPRHRERVLGEMRYLVQQSVLPDSLDDPRIGWELRTALITERQIGPEQWTRYWRATERQPAAAWALPMQERLLWRSIGFAKSRGSLPDGFPTRAASPTGLWAMFRLLALLEVGDYDAALAQADRTADSTGDVRAIRVRLHLLRNDWNRALAASPRDDPATSYLVRVIAPTRVVDSLAAVRDSPLRSDARLTTAARLAHAGQWQRAQAFGGVDAAHARAWGDVVRLAADTSRRGELAFARWMRDHRGSLFFGERTFWLRGLNWRRRALQPDPVGGSLTPSQLDSRLPWTAADERARIDDHFRSTTELSYALRAYARWLDGATATTPGLAAVVREADQVYNRLVNWDAGNSPFWAETLASSAEARSIRRAGALVAKR